MAMPQYAKPLAARVIPTTPEMVSDKKEMMAFSLVFKCLKRKARGATLVLDMRNPRNERRAKLVNSGCW